MIQPYNLVPSPSISGQSTGLLVSSDALTAKKANKFFRYASAGYDTGSSSWAVQAVLSWVNVRNYLTTPGTQGDCGESTKCTSTLLAFIVSLWHKCGTQAIHEDGPAIVD